MRVLKTAFVALTCAPAPCSSAFSEEAVGVGVLGDSYSDEYQFYQPDRCTSRNWVEILTATRGLNFGQFSTSSRGEPRNAGYEFNWARSDATTDDLLASGQHTGVAEQVASGRVKFVAIFIGGNDFIHALKEADPASALERVLPRAMANYRTILDTVLAASPVVKVVTMTVPEIRDLPEIRDVSRDLGISDSLLAQYSVALTRYNAQIRSLALHDPRVAVADFDLTSRIANRVSRRFAFIGGHKLDKVQSGNSLGHLFLADKRHFGIIGQGLMAQMFIHALDAKFNAGISPLSDKEIVGIANSLSGPSESPAAVAKISTKADSAELAGAPAP